MVTRLNLAFSVKAAVMMFLHSLAALSEEMSHLDCVRLRESLHRVMRTERTGAPRGDRFGLHDKPGGTLPTGH